ncbi:unnamed protein product, partial [Ectocarpus fasciculatus]
ASPKRKGGKSIYSMGNPKGCSIEKGKHSCSGSIESEVVYFTTTTRTAASPSFLRFVHSELKMHTPLVTCRWPRYYFDCVVQPAVRVDFAEFCCVFFFGRQTLSELFLKNI